MPAPATPGRTYAVTDRLMDLGFIRSEQRQTEIEAANEAAGANSGGPLTVIDVLVQHNTVLVIEQNVGTDDFAGLSAQITYPAVAIIEGPKGRVAFNPSDTALAERLAVELS